MLAIGDKLVAQGALRHRDDAFFLTWQELDGFLSGSEVFPDIARRKREHERLANIEPPEHFVLPVGEYLDPTTFEDGDDDDTATQTLLGIGAGTGKVRGPAAVLDDVTECKRLKGGDVLVARQTDPGWGPAFPLIKGLVLERGGLLSHGAILAREFGIPSVVGVKGAMRLITDGRSLEVDGDSGRVHLVE
jgi:pyruvate,water dikinase